MHRGNGSGFYNNGLPPSPPASSGRVPQFQFPAGFMMTPQIPQGARIGNVTINFRRGGSHAVLLDCNPCPETVMTLHQDSLNNGGGNGRPATPETMAGSQYSQPQSGYSSLFSRSGTSMSSLSSQSGDFGENLLGSFRASTPNQSGIMDQQPPPGLGFRPIVSNMQQQQQSHSMGSQTDDIFDGDNEDVPDSTTTRPALPSPGNNGRM